MQQRSAFRHGMLETDAHLNLVYSTKFLNSRGRKLREERVEVGYHVFVALQDLFSTYLANAREIC